MKSKLIHLMDQMAAQREQWILKHEGYYTDLVGFLRFHIADNSDVLEVGSGTGFVLDSLQPHKGVGIDLAAKMVAIARQCRPHLHFLQMDAEDVTLSETFDFILLSDTVGYLEDVQKVFAGLKPLCRSETRLVITFQNYLWAPIFVLAEFLRLKMPSTRLNWLNIDDLCNLLTLSGFEVIKTGRRFLCPLRIPWLSYLVNKYLAHLPLINKLCITTFIIARPSSRQPFARSDPSVTVVVPARNEKGNIEALVKRMPRMGSHTEIIFVEGGSTDGTCDEIKRVCDAYADQWDLRYAVQAGTGKGDAVRTGFAMAAGDILMILDADLTVPPEQLPRFYDVMVSGQGEYVHGSRLVYPLEKEAMRSLNVLANKLFSLMFSWLLGQKIKDTLCGTKVISKLNWERLSAHRQYFGDFDPFGDFDLIFGAAKLDLQFKEIPIRYQARRYGSTNISRFRHGWLLLKMVIFAMGKIKFH